MQHPIKFKNKKKQTLRGFVHVPKKYDTAIVFLHGFPGHCGGSTTINASTAVEKMGYLVLRFDFSGTDTSDGKFEDKLMSQEVKDVKYAIDFLCKNYDFEKLVLVGHSTGAIDAALYAHTDKRVDKLILLGGVCHLDVAVNYDFTARNIRDFWTKGYITYKNREPGKKWWCQNKRLKKEFYDEFFTLDIPKAIKKWKKPLLIVHGEKDEAIPAEKDPKELFALANRPKKLVIIKGADHRFTNSWHALKLLRVIHKFISN
jgi:uncharacterized protein